MSNLRRMLARAFPGNHYDDKIDRQWSATKRRGRWAEQRETEQEFAEVQSMADGDRHVLREPYPVKTCRHGIPITDPNAANCAFYEDPEHQRPAGPARRPNRNGK